MNVAIIGLGVVGRGVYDILRAEDLGINVRHVLDIDKEKLTGLEHLSASDIKEIVEDPETDVVIELIGGVGHAYDFIRCALEHKKHVVSANKALISKKLRELNKLARDNGVRFLFEASVGGGIIVLDTLYHKGLINDIHKITGILNGSVNYTLSKIFNEGASFEKALRGAYERGYLERNSDDDMSGRDSLRKINILSAIAYRAYFKEEEIFCAPLRGVSPKFIRYLQDRDLTLKYMAISEKQGDDVIMYTVPHVVGKHSLYGGVNDEYNIVSIHGRYHKRESLMGQGTGRYPTAAAVIYDLLGITDKRALKDYFFKEKPINLLIKKFRFLCETNREIYVTKPLTLNEVTKENNVLFYAIMSEDTHEEI